MEINVFMYLKSNLCKINTCIKVRANEMQVAYPLEGKWADGMCEQKLIAEKMKFSIKNFFSKCGQSRRFLRIWSPLLKKSLMGNFIFCAVFDRDVELAVQFSSTIFDVFN